MKNSLFLLTCVAFLGCNSSENKTPPPPSPTSPGVTPDTLTPTYTSIHEKIIKPKCLGCHSGNSEAAQKANFETYEGTRQKVTPGDLQHSELYDVVFTKQMPPSPRPSLSDAEIEAIKQWILSGAAK
jgi:hypothetical protein